MKHLVSVLVISFLFFAAYGMIRVQFLMLETKTVEIIIQALVAIVLSDALFRNLKKTE
jgi:hypothetical protein